MMFTAKAKRWSGGWELHISDESGSEVGVTQTRTLDTAEQQVRDYLESQLDTDQSSTHITITAELGTLSGQVAAARKATRAAKEAERLAAATSRSTVRQLRSDGLSMADTAYVMGVSKGRISQLVKG